MALHRQLLIAALLLFMLVTNSSSAADSLREERMINPLDAFTAEVLHEGEWLYGQPLAPAPGWLFWGATDRLTVQFDLMAWLGGVASANCRYSLISPAEHPMGLAWETMALYLPNRLEDLNHDQEFSYIERSGFGLYSRLHTSWELAPGHRCLLSAGVSYSRDLLIRNENRPEVYGAEFHNYVEPVGTLALDSRWAPWVSFHATASYGETFTYQENRPRKLQATYGFRFAPFLGHSWGILNNLRIETAALIIYFPDARELSTLYWPVYPHVYWQWGGKTD